MSRQQWIFNAGVAVFGLGGSLGVAYLIYCFEAHVSFWNWPGIGAILATVAGAVMMCLPVFSSENERGAQVQKSGSGSVNYQAGGDIRVGVPSDE